MQRFTHNLLEVTQEMFAALHTLLSQPLLPLVLGAIAGGLVIAALILAQSMLRLPTILHYSCVESFNKLARRDKHGTYNMSYNEYMKLYDKVRSFFLIGLMLFCLVFTIRIFL